MTIATHNRTKIEIIVDHPHLPRVTKVLERQKVQGYSVFSSLEGKGSRGRWSQARLTDADDRLLIIAVTSSETADSVMNELAELFEEIPGVVFASDVRVIRSERF
jgi:nitrogen regulatory protein PII